MTRLSRPSERNADAVPVLSINRVAAVSTTSSTRPDPVPSVYGPARVPNSTAGSVTDMICVPFRNTMIDGPFVTTVNVSDVVQQELDALATVVSTPPTRLISRHLLADGTATNRQKLPLSATRNASPMFAWVTGSVKLNDPSAAAGVTSRFALPAADAR